MEFQILVVVVVDDSAESDRLMKWWSWWLICEDWAVMGRWRVAHNGSMNALKLRERNIFKKTAARWETNNGGLSLCYWIDVTSWCEQLMREKCEWQDGMRNKTTGLSMQKIIFLTELSLKHKSIIKIVVNIVSTVSTINDSKCSSLARVVPFVSEASVTLCFPTKIYKHRHMQTLSGWHTFNDTQSKKTETALFLSFSPFVSHSKALLTLKCSPSCLKAMSRLRFLVLLDVSWQHSGERKLHIIYAAPPICHFSTL